ncbi:unnamed protein product [Mesocestoides corti]|uniref:AXH domain-containing protein n=1 Tax=Mesocestoides corti TaxID=53468 RepID=A0A0R3UNR2_MESCO|nr:unnamed protein product [Mesocestoides corti]
MELLPFATTQKGNALSHLSPPLPDPRHLTPSPLSLADHLAVLKAATASYGLFASLISSHRKQVAPSSPPAPPPPPSAFSRPQGPHHRQTPPKRRSGPPFRRGGRVQLADGSLQKIEALKLSDFLRTAATSGADSLLYWAEVKRISTEISSGSQRALMKIQFSLNGADEGNESGVAPRFLPIPTFEHICCKDQPFFVRSLGWSSFEPQLTQARCGLLCRKLVIGDSCLVLAPPGLAKTSLCATTTTTSFSPVYPVPIKTEEALSQPDGRPRNRFFHVSYQKSESDQHPSSLPATFPQQPLDLKKVPSTNPRGAVPKYFSAASLAESPFQTKH